MSSRKYVSETGFTIIEVLIVLAIAGVIMLIVFEAIPTLMRNGRNNQRKQDVAAILQAVSHYELANDDNVPECGTGGSGIAPCYNPTDSTTLLYHAKLTYYTDSSNTSVMVQPQENTSSGAPNYAVNHPALTSSGDQEKVNVYNYERCDTTTQGAATTQGAGFNDVVAQFALESGSGVTPQCEQL